MNQGKRVGRWRQRYFIEKGGFWGLILIRDWYEGLSHTCSAGKSKGPKTGKDLDWKEAHEAEHGAQEGEEKEMRLERPPQAQPC